MVGWKTDAADSAAVQFSEQFYGSVKDGESVEVAYFHAIKNMKSIYRWQVSVAMRWCGHMRIIKVDFEVPVPRPSANTKV